MSNPVQVKGRIIMKAKIITALPILSLAIILGACGSINETYDTVEFTETTVPVATESTTTALTGSTTAVTSNVSTVTTLDTTTALTSVTDGSTVIDPVTAETEAKKQQDNVQDNMQDVVATQPPEPIEIKVEDTKYNDSNSETPTTAVTTTTTETKTTDVATTAITEITATAAETTVVTTENNEPFLVYKPSTKYAHRSTCRWNKDDAYRCDDFSNLETRICTECNPDVGDHIEYQAPTIDSGTKTYLGNFYMTYYPETAYYPGVCGGSGRTLRGYGDYSDGIRGSVACRTIQESYGYDKNGRTTIYLEFPSYPNMNGNYWVDDACGSYNVIDVFVWSDLACPFGYDGTTWADCWIY